MRAIPTAISGVLVLEPVVHRDLRGEFHESFNARDFAALTGVDCAFVQDNHSLSAANVLRGLHYQLRQPQGKLVRVVRGAIFDVAVDLRRESPTCGRWTAVRLDAATHRQLWIPEGCAHGFLALDAAAEVLYKTTDYYAPEYERCLAWNDPALAIDWPLAGAPILSAKDAAGRLLAECLAEMQDSR